MFKDLVFISRHFNYRTLHLVIFYKFNYEVFLSTQGNNLDSRLHFRFTFCTNCYRCLFKQMLSTKVEHRISQYVD